MSILFYHLSWRISTHEILKWYRAQNSLKTWSYQFRNCQYKDKMVSSLSHLHNGHHMLVRWYFYIESHLLDITEWSETAVICTNINVFYQCNSVHEMLSHWGQVTHICVSKLSILGSDNGLSPDRRQAIIWTNAEILLMWPLGTNFWEILVEINTFPFKKMHLKMSSGKWRPFVSAPMY